MTEEERQMVLRILRDAGLRVVSATLLTDGSMTVRVRRPELKS